LAETLLARSCIFRPFSANASNFAGDITKAKAGALSVTKLFQRVPSIDVWSDKGEKVTQLKEGNIKFDDVHFRYPTRYGIMMNELQANI
jgi:hypothetical protein